MLLRTRAGRATATAAGALALTTLVATASPALAAKPDRAGGDKPAPVQLFPTDQLTVVDRGQITGLRVALPTAGCGGLIACGTVERLNQLDGFDLDPRLSVRFDGPVDPAAAAERITVQSRSHRTGVDRVVWDPATNTLYAHPAEQLRPSTTYRLRVQGGPENKAAHTDFTTYSATDGLLDLRRQIESGAAFAAADIADRGLRIDQVVPAAGTTLVYRQDRGVTHHDEPATNVLAGTGATYVFGSYLAPSWLRADVTIEQTPTRDGGPVALDDERVPFVAVLPGAAAPAGGWPVAVYGHGFTRSTADVLLAAATNARSGLATIATSVVGHGYGPESEWVISHGGTTVEVPAYGRGVDQDGDGVITSTEGSSATGGAASVGSRDALRQTAADIMTLLRAVGGTDVDGNGAADLSGAGVTYFGQSFGGIYGTMLTGADPAVARSVLNVPGGPVTEIVRLSPVFRGLLAQTLQAQGLLNSNDPARVFFREQMPLRGEGPVVATVPGALAIQDYLARATWLTRAGSPETFAPLVEDDRVVVQVAYADRTVPNPTSYTLAAAGHLFDRVSLYRNDLAVNALENPHGFLLRLDNLAALQGQAQVAAFLTTGAVVDPDAAGPVWEVPIDDPGVLLDTNYEAPFLLP